MAWQRKKTDPDAPRRPAYDKAMGLLVRREQSQFELRAKLQRSGYDSDEINAAMDRLVEQRYQDDGRFADVLLRSRVAQGYGPMRLRLELKTHGISEAFFTQWLAESDVDWNAVAADKLCRRYGSAGTSDLAERARRARFLLRRGFAAATVHTVTRADVDSAADSDD
ncbi:MAG: regulatory protein RecX [Rhodanobacter sp.]